MQNTLANGGQEPGPNNSPIARAMAPRLYPQFDRREFPASRDGYPGVQLTFGGINFNAVRIQENAILRPASLRPAFFGASRSRPGVVIESIRLQGNDSAAGITRLSNTVTESNIDCSYAVALQSSWLGDSGPWGNSVNGQIDLSGYLLSLKDRPAFAKLVDESIQLHVPIEARDAMRRKVDGSMLMITNLFEWQYLHDAIQKGDSGIGQPVFVRHGDGKYGFCGVVQDILPLTDTRMEANRGAVAYLVATPENIRKTQGFTP